MFKRRGVPITTAKARELMGAHKQFNIRMITEIPSVAKRWSETHGSSSAEQDIETKYQDFLSASWSVVRFCDLISGTRETVGPIRDHGLRIGSTTGYTAEIMKVLVPEAKR
jgi:phosphonoacetaldehyde hydrolase